MPPAKVVYGGLALSAVVGTAVVVDGLSTDVSEIPQALYLLAIDAPLSAVADTLTLPITIPATINKLRRVSDKKSAVSNADDGPASRESSESNE